MDPLHAISVPQPEFSVAEVEKVLAECFGLQGELQSLVSERDQNFRVVTPDQDHFVFKIANCSEPGESTDFQIKALLHIEQKHCDVPTPVVHRTIDGQDAATIGKGDNVHICRVVSHLPGKLLSGLEPTPDFAHHFGKCAAKLDLALADFEHAGQAQSLLWDMQRAIELRSILKYIADAELRSAAESCLDDFAARVVPVLSQLRRQVIHSDLHADNVLANNGKISGIIDFGDMLSAPLVVEVAVAAAYLRPAAEQSDVLALAGPFIAGYHSLLPLQDAELELLFDLIRARLVATVSILCWRTATRGENDEYSSQNISGESNAQEFLTRLNATGREAFNELLGKRLKNR